MSSLVTSPLQLQRIYHRKGSSQWLPVLALKIMGYSSLASAIISIVLYLYKKQSTRRHSTKQLDGTGLFNMAAKEEQDDGEDEEDDELYMNPKRQLHIATNPSFLKRSSSTFSNLSSEKQQMFTPPPSPCSPPMMRATSPLSSWSTRLLDGVMSTTLMNNIRKKKKLSISLKRTALWNPSRDVNTPNYAFHERTVSLLYKLAQIYDIYVITHAATEKERHQIQQLLSNANLLDTSIIDERKILWCGSEEGKLHLINHINPAIHIEGEDGNNVQKMNAERIIWIGSQQPTMMSNNNNSTIEVADRILECSIAKQVGF